MLFCHVLLCCLLYLSAHATLRDYDVFDLNYPEPQQWVRRSLSVKLDVFATPYAPQAKYACDSLISDYLKQSRVAPSQSRSYSSVNYHYHSCMASMIQSLRWRAIFAMSDTCFEAAGKHDDLLYALTMAFEFDDSEPTVTKQQGLVACLLGTPASHLLVPAVMAQQVSAIYLIVNVEDERFEANDKESVVSRWNLSVAEELAKSRAKRIFLSFHHSIKERVNGVVNPMTGEVSPPTVQRRLSLGSQYRGVCDVIVVNDVDIDSKDKTEQKHREEFNQQAIEFMSKTLNPKENDSVETSTRVIQLKSGLNHMQSLQTLHSIDWGISSTWYNDAYFFHHNDSNGFVAHSYGLPADAMTLTTAHMGIIHPKTAPVKACSFKDPKKQLFVVISYNLRVFAETALGTQQMLKRLGYRHVLVLYDFSLYTYSIVQQSLKKLCGSQLLHIVLDPHDLTLFTQNYIAFHMEQPWSNITTGWGKQRYQEVLSHALRIWTFSPTQLTLFMEAGFSKSDIDLVPLYTLDNSQRQVGLVSRDKFILNSGESSVSDVLFFGSGSPRRADILEPLLRQLDSEAGLHFRIFTGSWNSSIFDLDRDVHVHLAKVVFNINNDERSVIEAHRINYLLSMGKCIITERGIDSELANQYEGAVVFVNSSNELFEQIVYYATHDAERILMEEKALARHFELQKDTIKLAVALNHAVEAIKKQLST